MAPRMNRIVFHIQRDYAMRSIQIYIAQKGLDGRSLAYLQNATFQQIEEGELIPDTSPLLVFEEDAQLLMDNLWNVGIRPTENRDKSDIINAKNEHIRDLREITRNLFERIKKVQ